MIISSATISPCKTWRYDLIRHWCMFSDRRLVFIGLNPSTADESQDDPTIRRCIGFAKRFGYGGMVMLNLFAYRATLPIVMMHASDPVGPDNDKTIISYVESGHDFVAVWGHDGGFFERDDQVIKMIPKLYCLGMTIDGKPRHPLYLKGNSPLVEFKR